MSRFVLSDPQLPPRQSLAPRLGNAVDVQMQSPLFSAIPAETRNRIFSIALTAYDDKSKPYHPQNWFYRPDWHFHRKISTTLLRTCKRVYLECHLLPLALNSHTFWAGPARAPPAEYFPGAYKKPLLSGLGRLLSNWAASENFRGFFNKLTAEQRAAVGELHFFFQQCYLEAVRFSPPLDPDSGRPVAARKLKITIRHQDWYWWEDDQRLGICPWNRGRTTWDGMDTPMPRKSMDFAATMSWGAQLQYIEGLQEFELVMETLVRKKGQLDAIAERAKRWIFPLPDCRFLRWDRATGVQESWWEEDDLPLNADVPKPDEPLPHGTSPLTTTHAGLSDGSEGVLRNAVGEHALSQSSVVAHSGVIPPAPNPPPPTKRQYYVVSLTWKEREKDGDDDDDDDDDESPPGAQTTVEWRPMSRWGR
jgi:hypothetical protein